MHAVNFIPDSTPCIALKLLPFIRNICAVLILLVTWSSQPLVSLGWNLLGPNVLTFVSVHCWLLNPYSCLSSLCWNFFLIASLSLAHLAELIITATFVPCVRLACPLLPSLALSAYTAGYLVLTVSNLPCLALSAYTAGYLILTVSDLPCLALSAYTAGYLILTVSNLPCIGTDFPVAFLTFVGLHCWFPVAFITIVGIHCWLPDPHSHCFPCVPLSAYSGDLHSHLSPMCTFVSIHYWLPDCQSHLSPFCEAGLQVPCCHPYLCKHTLLFTLFSQLLVSLAWDWRPYCLPYLCKHTLLVTVASQSFASHVWDWRPYCLPYLCQHTLRDTVASQSFVSLVWDWRPYCFPYLCQHTLLVMMAPQSFMYHV